MKNFTTVASILLLLVVGLAIGYLLGRSASAADPRPAQPLDRKDRDQDDSQNKIIEMNRTAENKIPDRGPADAENPVWTVGHAVPVF